MSSLCDLLLSRSLDHLSVTESWLTSNDSITIPDLTNSLEDDAVYHLPRSTRRGGGLAVTVERFLSDLSAFLEELTVTSCQFLVCSHFNFHVNDNSNANPKQFSDFLFSADLSSPIQVHWERTLELVGDM